MRFKWKTQQVNSLFSSIMSKKTWFCPKNKNKNTSMSCCTDVCCSICYFNPTNVSLISSSATLSAHWSLAWIETLCHGRSHRGTALPDSSAWTQLELTTDTASGTGGGQFQNRRYNTEGIYSGSNKDFDFRDEDTAGSDRREAENSYMEPPTAATKNQYVEMYVSFTYIV